MRPIKMQTVAQEIEDMEVQETVHHQVDKLHKGIVQQMDIQNQAIQIQDMYHHQHLMGQGTGQSFENNLEGYYQDVNGRWHRPNGQFASNEEVGIPPSGSSETSDSDHGNSLNYKGINYGYRLVDKNTGEILKYGETINPSSRYTQSYLNENNARMEVITSGDKVEIHNWQHEQILCYKRQYGVRPLLNKSDW